jgi:hypothetical protein
MVVVFLIGLLIVVNFSFYDDLRLLPPVIRMLLQAVAVALMVVPLGEEWWIVALAIVLILGDSLRSYETRLAPLMWLPLVGWFCYRSSHLGIHNLVCRAALYCVSIFCISFVS